MRIIKLLALLICQILFFSCSEQGIYVDNTSKQIVERNQLVTQSVKLLTPGCNLLPNIDKNIQDTILRRLASDIALERTGYKQGLFPYLKSTVKFVPTIVVSRTWKHMDEDAKLFQISKDIVCFYGQNEKGEMMCFRAIYTDNSHFTKDTNPKMYRANVELFGQEFADKLIEKIRNARGAEAWSIGLGGLRNEEVEFAKSHSDDGTFFTLVRDRYSFPIICFFKDKKVYCCCKNNQDEWGMERLENYLER